MKKQIRLLMVVAAMFLSISAFAQKPFAGRIVFEMSAEGSSNPAIAAELAESTMEYIVMGNNYRMNMNQGIDIITIANGNNKTYTVILGIPGYGNYYIEQTAEDLAKKQNSVKRDYQYTEETRTIAGYNCKKVIVTVTDLETDEEDSAVLWVTSELGVGDDINFYDHPGLKGYPLRTEMKTEIDGETVTLCTTATSVTPDKKIKPTMFLLPSDAKSFKDAPDELKQMLGGGGEEE